MIRYKLLSVQSTWREGTAGTIPHRLLTVGGLVSRIGYAPYFACLSILDIVWAILLWTLVGERTAA